MSPDLFRKLAALGLTNDQMAGVLDIMAADAEVRKAKGRDRWHKWKEKKGANVSQRLQHPTNVSSQLTRADDAPDLENKQTNKQENKKETTSPSARSTRGTRIPDDFSPDIAAAVSEGLSQQEAQRQALSFVDYWHAKPGKDALKLDWPATWRTWFRRRLSEPPRGSGPPPGRRMNAVEAYNEIAREKGWTNEPVSTPGDSGNVEFLPPRIARHETPAHDVLGNVGRRFRQSD